MKTIRTADQVRRDLDQKGMTVTHWAAQNNIPRSIVYGLLRGRLTGAYGKAHNAAVLLGMKNGEVAS